MEERKVYKDIMKLWGEGTEFSSICKEVGDVLHTSTLMNGALMIICKTFEQ